MLFFISYYIVFQMFIFHMSEVHMWFFKSEWLCLTSLVMENKESILKMCNIYGKFLNSLRPNHAIWHHRSGSILVQVMACCLTASSHYLNRCWLRWFVAFTWEQFHKLGSWTNFKTCLEIIKPWPHLLGTNELGCIDIQLSECATENLYSSIQCCFIIIICFSVSVQ